MEPEGGRCWDFSGSTFVVGVGVAVVDGVGP